MAQAGFPTFPQIGSPTQSDRQRISQYSDQEQFGIENVLDYIRQFNQQVLLPGGRQQRPDVVGRDARGGLFARDLFTLDVDEDLSRQAFESFFVAGSDRDGSLQRRFIAEARRIFRGESGRVTQEEKDQISLFLEILEAARLEAGQSFLGTRTSQDPNAGSKLHSRSSINNALDRYYENTTPDIEDRTLENVQAFTAIVQRQQGLLSILTPSILQSGLVNLFYKDIYQIEAEDSSTFLSLFTNKPDYQSWFSAPSVVLSCITPKIRIYKQYNTSDGEKVDVEFEFPNKMDSENINKIATGNGRGGGYGIKSFSWDYEGQNPFEISRSIKAKLELYIQDLSKLFPPEADISNERVTFDGNGSTQQGYIFELFRLVRRGEQGDLVSYPENSEAGSFIDPYDYRLKIDVAWNFDQNTLTNLGYQEYIGFFEEAVKTLDLGLEAHDINFNQDGSIGISLSYRSFLDSILQNSDFYNILSIGDQRLLDRINHIRQRGEEIDAAAGEEDSEDEPTPCQQTESVLSEDDNGNRRVNTNTKIFQNLIEVDYNDPNNIIANYSSIFNTLIEQSRIYVLGFDFGNLADRITVEDVEAIVNNTEGEIEGEEREAYLRIVQNELTLEFIKNQEFNVGRLTKDGVLFLQDALQAEQEILAQEIADQDLENVNLSFQLQRQTPLSLLNTPTTSVEANPYTEGAEQTGQYVRTYFTTLGDIIQAVMGALADANLNIENNVEIEDLPYLISGPYSFKDVEGRNILINLSNILVDIDAFRKFFTEKIMSGLATSYTLETFIKEMYSYFCYETNARAALQGTSLLSSRSRLFYNSFSKTYAEPREELLLRFGKKAQEDYINIGPTNTSIGFKDNDNTIIFPRSFNEIEFGFREVSSDINTLLSEFKPKIINVKDFFEFSEGFSQANDTENPSSLKTYNYIYITANPVQLVVPEGVDFDNYDYSEHRLKDKDRGIFHLTFGEKNSIIKNLTFQKFDDPSLRTARTIGEGADNLNYLRELYNVNLSLIGTPFLMPGQYLYLNPIFMGAGGQARDISEFLGFGGYYVVLNTVNKIDANHNYTTECKLHWQSFGRQRDEDLCFLQAPISLYSEEAIEMATIQIQERADVFDAQQDLQEAIREAGGVPSGAPSDGVYQFNDYALGERGTGVPPTSIEGLRIGMNAVLTFGALDNISFSLNLNTNEINFSFPNDTSIDASEFVSLNENSDEDAVVLLIQELQAILDAHRTLQDAQSQLEGQNDQ